MSCRRPGSSTFFRNELMYTSMIRVMAPVVSFQTSWAIMSRVTTSFLYLALPQNLILLARDFLSDGARTSGQRGHFGQPRRPEKPKQTSVREGLPRHLLPQRPPLKLSALVRPR